MNALTLTALTRPSVTAHRRADSRAGVLERMFVVLVLFLATKGLLPLLRLEGSAAMDDVEGDPVMQIMWLAVYSVTLVLLAMRARVALRLLGRERWLIVLCCLAVMSILWSVAPGVTFRRTVALFGTTGFGVYLASRYTVAELLRLVSLALGVAVILSVAVEVFAPAYSLSNGAGWRGIFIHKNGLGRAMALAILTFLFQIRQRGFVNRLATMVALALACLALLGSQAVAGMLAAATVVITVPLWPILRLERALAVASAVFGLLAIVAVAIWIGTNPEIVMTAVGKDSSLTGCTGLWLAIIDSIANRLWLGHGYGAFWLGWDGESAAVWSALQWRPATAHNGLLQLGLELGVVGLALLGVGFTVAVGRATLVIRRTRTVHALWPISYLMLMVMVNLAEATLMEQNSVFWMLYVVTCMWLVRPHSEGRKAAA